MIHLCTFTDSRMTISAQLLVESAAKHGVDHCRIYKPADLSHDFITMALPTINIDHGSGEYIWKPYIVWRMMNEVADGDHLIYADAGQTIINSVQSLIDKMDQDMMMFSNGWKHLEWCKMDVYYSILPGRGNNNMEDAQTQASLIFFKVTPESRNFVKEWMLWCLMPGFCDNSPSKLPNVPTFQETRWDQSVLCCLQIKYGYKLHWFPTSTAMHLPGAGVAIVDHHRKRNNEW